MSFSATTTQPRTFFLPVVGGHELYVEDHGNLGGVPVVALHGGPGAGASIADATVFDPAIHRTIVFDQRGAGRSRPLGSLEDNNTGALIADIEAIRKALNIERWIVFGRSWGSYLALRYCLAHPDRCVGLLLFAAFFPTTNTRSLYVDPPTECSEQWARCAAFLTADDAADPLAAFARRIIDDGEQKLAAATALTAFQTACTWAGTAIVQHRAAPSSEQIVGYTRVQLHYYRNGYFHNGHSLDSAATALPALPIELVHGNGDLICPLRTSEQLSELLGSASLNVVKNGPHAAYSPNNLAALKTAAKNLSSRTAAR